MEPLLNTLHVTGQCPDLFSLDPAVEQLIIEDCEGEILVPDLPGVKSMTFIGCPDLIIGHVAPGLESLTIQNCPSIKYLPRMPRSFVSLEVRDCPDLSIVGVALHTLDLLIIDRCPKVALDALPPVVELNLISLVIDSFPASVFISALRLLHLKDCRLDLTIIDSCTLRELAIDSCVVASHLVPLTLSPSTSRLLTRLEVLNTPRVALPFNMSEIQELVLISSEVVTLPQMPKLHSLELSPQGAMTNDRLVYEIYSYKEAWGSRRPKRPTRRSEGIQE